MVHRFPVFSLLILLIASAGPSPASDPPGVETIRRADLMGTVKRLAAPELAGRLAGSPGYQKTAFEMARRFREAGLKGGGDHGYLQDLAVEYNEITDCRLALIRPDGTVQPLELGRDFACRGLTGSGKVTAPLLFVGYGLSHPEQGFDEYAGVDARGKIVLALKEAPPFRADSVGWGDSWMPRPKGLVAAAHGAIGLLLVSRPNQEHPQKPIGSVLEGEGEQDSDFPRLQLALPVAEEILRAAGFDLAALEAGIDSTKSPASRELSLSARIRVQARYRDDAPSVNVVGILEGADPALRDQYVVVGAHLDHVGAQGGKIYFPGANDNASGAATLLAIAESLARNQVRPRRSLVFGLWSSEESGCNGARWFLAHPPVPKQAIVAYLNFDCVGHGDSIEVGGGESYPRLWELVRDLDQQESKLLIQETGKGGGADAGPFEANGIRNLYFASSFSYTHLHLTTDTPETLNPALLEAVARLGCRTAWSLAERDSLGEN